MKMKTLFLLLLSILFSCQQNSSRISDKPVIVTSIFPIYDIIKNIVPDEVDVIYAVPVGANPHSFEPTPSLIQKLQNSQVFVGVHPHLDGWIESLVSKKSRILYLSHFLEGEDDHGHDHHHNHHHEIDNPHLWLSLKTMKEILPQLSAALSGWFENSEKVIRQKSVSYIEKIDSVDQEIQKQFHNIQNPSFIQWHSAWNDFAGDYGLSIIGTLTQGHGDNPSIGEFQHLIEDAKKMNVQTIVIGLHVEDTSIKSLKDAIDGSVLRLDTLGDPDRSDRDTYLKLMMTNARLLSEALQ